MIMKNTLTLLCLALTVLTSGCAFGQMPTHPWTATIKVIGEDSNPIAGADIAVGYDLPPPAGRNPEEGPDAGQIKGITDTNGMFYASHTDSSWTFGVNVEKTGYYATRIGHNLYVPGQFDDKTVAASRNPTLTLVLKKIGQPIAMYGKWVQRWPVKTDATIGYDLMAGDWIAPYGKGVNTDIIFTRKFDKKTKTDYDYKLSVSFPKAGDGIQEFTVPEAEKGSGLRSPHEAPEDGYQSQLVRENFHHPGQAGKSDYDDNRNYFFRVRTVLDSNGNVKSALYGKIYGDPEQMNFRYYLNPTPNSRNIECDPKQNLLGGLESFEQIKAP